MNDNGFDTPPDWLMEALKPLDEELKEFCDRVVGASMRAAEAHEPGTGHNATVAAFTIFAIRMGVFTIARAGEVNEQASVETITAAVVRDIAQGTAMTIAKLAETAVRGDPR